MLFDIMNSNKGVELLIVREPQHAKQTQGRFIVFDENQNVIYSGVTLELPFKNNERNISCIPKGCYKGVKYHSRKFGEVLAINPVLNRYGILVHSGNFYTQTRGCVLVGQYFKDLNNDSLLDVVNSQVTLKCLLMALKYDFDVQIMELHKSN